MTTTEEHDPVGSTFESWLEEEGILEEATEHAVKAVISWQLQKTMTECGLSKKSMAALMGTSDRSWIGFSTRRAVPSP
jgi:hypothetical protein